MKALTIFQPYAHFICLPESLPDHKRAENRTWPTKQRGTIAIHAGKSTKYLSKKELASYVTGAVVAVADLVDCLTFIECRSEKQVKYPGCEAIGTLKALTALFFKTCGFWPSRFRWTGRCIFGNGTPNWQI